jgi:16S rRNA (uracil1498-N3)-methyltransferase
MQLPFFYYPTDYNVGKKILLEGDIIKHIVHVLRMQPGEQIKLTDGLGNLATIEIKNTSKKNCEVEVIATEGTESPQTKLYLGIAFTKNAGRNEWLLEKATELGVTAIYPLITTRAEKFHVKEDRWKNILISAMLQSQQCYLPVLEKPQSFRIVIGPSYNVTQKFIAHCEPGVDKMKLSAIMEPGKSAMILIGPEGDFTTEEIDWATQNGFKGIDLGESRLRTETAAMAVCSYFKLVNS